MSHEWPTISVVIPSVGRAELSRAVSSVRSQDYEGDVELVVVFDLPAGDAGADAARAASGADIVDYTGGGRRGGYARNLGVERSSGPWIAFLDDDDEWVPSKLRLQVEAALKVKAEGKRPVVGSRVQQVLSDADKTEVVAGIPIQLIKPGQNIENYLFVGRRPGARRASFFTSTILTERSTCEVVPWDASLARHQDWDWLIRASRLSDVCFLQVENDLVSYYVGSQGSISAGSDWRGSLEWAERQLRPAGSKVLVDFLTAQTLRYALQKRDWSGVRTVLGRIGQSGVGPSWGPVFIGAAGLLPRKSLQSLMSKIR